MIAIHYGAFLLILHVGLSCHLAEVDIFEDPYDS